jgi:type IV pilus assembly protein PilX
MLNNAIIMQDRTSAPRAQSGIVLIVALIILIAMTIAGIAMIRSVDLTNIIAGNLAFKQAATHSGDTGVETAFSFLTANQAGTFLHNDHADQGYSANGNDATRSPAAGQTWEAYWANLPAARIRTITPDRISGYTVSYIIDRLCANSGDPAAGANCSASTVASVASGSGQEAGEKAITSSSAIYYRITVRILGPRNTVSFIQSMVTL